MTVVVETAETPAEAVSGVEIFVPLNKLNKSPRNARKVPHGEAAIEALAASIHHKGMIQNLVVEPEVKDGAPTGAYLVTAGEGRRLAQVLRAKRKQIKKTEPIRCWLDTENDPAEISLDENVTRTNMHPADEYERFHELSRDKGWGVEEIAARFGRPPDLVRRRLRLGAVSPKLIAIYRQDGLTLDQLMAFAVSEDHARQEQVFENLSWNKQPALIRRDMTAGKVPGDDRRAVFVGQDAYQAAGGVVTFDLFAEGGGAYFEDPGLLDALALEKLREIAAEVKDEGWRWAEASIDFPHDHGMPRYYPETLALSDADEARASEAAAEYDALTEGYSSYDELPEDVAAKVEALENEIAALNAGRSGYDPDVVARGGAFVFLGPDGAARIDRGFVRPEDQPQTEAEAEAEGDEDAAFEDEGGGAPETEDGTGRPDAGAEIPESLTRDLTAHRTLGLRLALGEQPYVAMVALTHAFVSDLFYRDTEGSCLQVRAVSESLRGHAEGIANTPAWAALAERHDRWAEHLPRDLADLWAFIVALDGDSREALLAHCASLTVNAVKVGWETRPRRLAATDRLAEAVDLDMARLWRPTVRSYFGRLTKAQIGYAVRDAVSPEAADRISPMKKGDMAEAAEELVAATDWLPPVLRAPKPEPEREPETEPVDEPTDAETPDTEMADGERFDIAAE